MSAESERVFSGARRTITWERHQLGAEVVEQSECLKSWIRLTAKDGGTMAGDLAREVLEESNATRDETTAAVSVLEGLLSLSTSAETS